MAEPHSSHHLAEKIRQAIPTEDEEGTFTFEDGDLPGARAALDALVDQHDALWQEMEHPFDKSEFDAMYERIKRLEEQVQTAERDRDEWKERAILTHAEDARLLEQVETLARQGDEWERRYEILQEQHESAVWKAGVRERSLKGQLSASNDSWADAVGRLRSAEEQLESAIEVLRAWDVRPVANKPGAWDIKLASERTWEFLNEVDRVSSPIVCAKCGHNAFVTANRFSPSAPAIACMPDKLGDVPEGNDGVVGAEASAPARESP